MDKNIDQYSLHTVQTRSLSRLVAFSPSALLIGSYPVTTHFRLPCQPTPYSSFPQFTTPNPHFQSQQHHKVHLRLLFLLLESCIYFCHNAIPLRQTLKSCLPDDTRGCPPRSAWDDPSCKLHRLAALDIPIVCIKWPSHSFTELGLVIGSRV